MADAAFARRISFNERLYLAEERRQPGFCIQLVIEGDGALDIDALRVAVAQAAEANPGVRLVRRGVLGWMRWIAAGPVPPVREVRWTEGDPPAELERPLPPETGPTCEVVCAGPARLVFRC
ncbi:MAG: hypothetical protein KC620_14855, partial [Myxococcales bacterium]|nr:hypothetical protein [Myxococcales bacterium]